MDVDIIYKSGCRYDDLKNPSIKYSSKLRNWSSRILKLEDLLVKVLVKSHRTKSI